MVTSAAITDHLDRGLALLESTVQSLPELAKEWDQLGESAQVTLSLEWQHDIADYLCELEDEYRHGQLTPQQQARYRALQANLQHALPTIRRLHLYFAEKIGNGV
jgi:arginine decarboxylase-like protein